MKRNKREKVKKSSGKGDEMQKTRTTWRRTAKIPGKEKEPSVGKM
jgi:hypothetical protein